jgi:glucose-1-phosphate cytidylyltransferase
MVAAAMQTLLLAGGLGTRLAEHTETKPKPMVEVGPHPILWHIMNIYAAHGFTDFSVLCGYKAEVIKEYFSSFHLRNSDFTVNLKDGSRTGVRSASPDWRVTVLDTGLNTMTGGRIKRGAAGLSSTFMATYGDGVGDIDIGALVKFHRAHGKLATVTAVHPTARFGALDLHGHQVRSFAEKPQSGDGWINGGFFVFEPAVLDYIGGDTISLEREPLERLAQAGQLMAFQHPGFWQPMDTLREKKTLDALWDSGNAPWKVWT